MCNLNIRFVDFCRNWLENWVIRFVYSFITVWCCCKVAGIAEIRFIAVGFTHCCCCAVSIVVNMVNISLNQLGLRF